jgi:hypothetical protein
MPIGIALLTAAFALIVSGWKNKPITDVILGRDGRRSSGNVTLDSGSDASYGDVFGTSPITYPTTNGSHLGTIQVDGHPVALWIYPAVKWAKSHGWHGQVTSGWRDPSRVITPSPGLPVAPQGKSNHNGVAYPSGAIDVSDPDGFERALRTYPGLPLRRGTAIGDPIHFSATGH